MAGFIAKYPGRCVRCDKRFRKGTRIEPSDERSKETGQLGYEHFGDCDDYVDGEEAEYDAATYPDLEQIGSKPAGVCSRCFTVHKGECL